MKQPNKKDELLGIPGVGKSIAEDLHQMGIFYLNDLKDKNPETLFVQSNELVGKTQDRCLLYTFRCAVYFANGGREGEKLKWWNWKND